MDHEERPPMNFPGAFDGIKFNVRGRKQTGGGKDKIDAVLAKTPCVDFDHREDVAKAVQHSTTTGVTLSPEDARFYLAVINQIAAGLKPTDVFESFGLTYREFKRLLKRDSRLQEIYDQSLEVCREAREIILEDAAIKRAVDGVDEPVFFKGKQVATKKVYSDPLLLGMLKAHAPDRYADRQKVSHEGTVLQLHIDGVRSHNADPIDVTPVNEEQHEQHRPEPTSAPVLHVTSEDGEPAAGEDDIGGAPGAEETP